MQRAFRQCIGRSFAALLWTLAAVSAAAAPPPAAGQLNFDPPRIVVSEKPTRLLLIDGPPVRVPVEGTRLEFVVNTDWTVFHDPGARSWFLLDDGHWLRNNMLSSGNWLSTTDLPEDFLTLQLNSDWPDVAAAMPPQRPATPPLPVLISYEPTELVLVDGEMEWEPITGTPLNFVANTARDLFRLDGRYYLLLAGRGFSTKDVQRRWYAVRDLPGAFALIPADHARARVLAAVPGTPQAALAVHEAMQGHSRSLQPGAGSELEVPWVGEPHFVPVAGTALRRGENTPYQVLLHNNFHYLCHDGAWYRSASPTGPWSPAREVPEAIYGIPATDPAYNVTFVRVDAFDDSTGQVAFSSSGGYYGRYYTGASVVYGTGWYHPGYYSRAAYWRYPYAYGYWGPTGYYGRSETYTVNRHEQDWEWEMDGTKRRVYRYGPRNVVGGEYDMPERDGDKGDRR